MNPIQLMELHKDRFTKNDLAIYQEIIRDPEQVVSKTTSSLAETCGVSQPALSRFVKALGYERYRDFRSDLTAWIATTHFSSCKNMDKQAPFTVLSTSVDELAQSLTDTYLEELVSYLVAHDRIYASGVSKSFQPAQLLEILMRRSKHDVHAVISDELDELTDYMNERDLLIMFSVSACPKNMRDAIRANGDLMLVTANAGHHYQDKVDRTVVIPYAGVNAESGFVSPILFDIFVEMLARNA